MGVLSVYQNRVELNKITLVIFKFISVHVRRPDARNDVKCKLWILTIFRHAKMQKYVMFYIEFTIEINQIINKGLLYTDWIEV